MMGVAPVEALPIVIDIWVYGMLLCAAGLVIAAIGAAFCRK